MSLLGAIGGVFVCARDCAKARKVDEVGNVFADATEMPRNPSAKWPRTFAPSSRVILRQIVLPMCATAPESLQLRYTGPLRTRGATCKPPLLRYRPRSVTFLVASAQTPGARFLTTDAFVESKRVKGKKSYQRKYQNQLNKGYIQQTTFRLDLPVCNEDKCFS